MRTQRFLTWADAHMLAPALRWLVTKRCVTSL